MPPHPAPASAATTVPATLRLRALLATSTVFVVAYALANQWTAQRSDIGEGVFAFERAIPFLPWTIVPYLSLVGFYVASFFVGDRAALDRHAGRVLVDLALSLACYALFPLRFQFERPVTEGAVGTLFELLGACDLPYNRAPSLHISVLLILSLRLVPFVPPRWRGPLHAWFALIGASVLTTWQHHLIDIPAGLAVGALSVWLTSPAAARMAAKLRAAVAGLARPQPRPSCTPANGPSKVAVQEAPPWTASRTNPRPCVSAASRSSRRSGGSRSTAASPASARAPSTCWSRSPPGPASC